MGAEEHDLDDARIEMQGCGERPAVDVQLTLVALAKQFQRIDVIRLEIDHHGAGDLPGGVLAQDQPVHNARPPFLALHKFEGQLAEDLICGALGGEEVEDLRHGETLLDHGGGFFVPA